MFCPILYMPHDVKLAGAINDNIPILSYKYLAQWRNPQRIKGNKESIIV